MQFQHWKTVGIDQKAVLSSPYSSHAFISQLYPGSEVKILSFSDRIRSSLDTNNLSRPAAIWRRSIIIIKPFHPDTDSAIVFVVTCSWTTTVFERNDSGVEDDRLTVSQRLYPTTPTTRSRPSLYTIVGWCSHTRSLIGRPLPLNAWYEQGFIAWACRLIIR